MNDVIITSGRENPHIDPTLFVWDGRFRCIYSLAAWWPGYCFSVALYYLRGNGK